MVTIRTGLVGPQEYVPEFGGNRDAAEQGEDFWHVVLEPATKGEMRAIDRKLKGRSAHAVAKHIVETRVSEFHNLTLARPDGSEFSPADGVGFWAALSSSSPELDAIAAELVIAVGQLSKLEAGLLGNLRSRSGTSPPRTRAATGPAGNVEEAIKLAMAARTAQTHPITDG